MVKSLPGGLMTIVAFLYGPVAAQAMEDGMRGGVSHGLFTTAWVFPSLLFCVLAALILIYVLRTK